MNLENGSEYYVTRAIKNVTKESDIEFCCLMTYIGSEIEDNTVIMHGTDDTFFTFPKYAKVEQDNENIIISFDSMMILMTKVA